MSVTSTEKKRRVIMFGLLGTALALAVILAAFVVFTPEKPSSGARLVTPNPSRDKQVAKALRNTTTSSKSMMLNKPMPHFKKAKVLFPHLWDNESLLS